MNLLGDAAGPHIAHFRVRHGGNRVGLEWDVRNADAIRCRVLRSTEGFADNPEAPGTNGQVLLSESQANHLDDEGLDKHGRYFYTVFAQMADGSWQRQVTAKVWPRKHGHLPHLMSRWPDDPTAYRPSVRWVGIVVVAMICGIFGLIGTYMWMAAHHNRVVAQFSQEWVFAGHGPKTSLSISPQTRTYVYSPEDTVTRETGDLLVEGWIDGRPVDGRIAVPRFPPWGSTLSVTLLGRVWTLRCENAGRRLQLVGDSGQVMILTPSQ